MVKLHDRSLDGDARYPGGIEWRARFAALARELGDDRMRFVETADACPLLAAADVMVTDHSSIGFEYLVLDRPLVVFDAPGLARAARVNPEKIALLRSAAAIALTPEEAARAAAHDLAHPKARSADRRRVAREMFYEPGTATARAARLLTRLIRPAGEAATLES
jgi:CDP-glycerol glycerophosphotransferase (TagB/SpsB family)